MQQIAAAAEFFLVFGAFPRKPCQKIQPFGVTIYG